MAIQGQPDLENFSSFMHHYSNEPLLMQFTCLQDKNGVDIYEWDILNCLKGNFKFGATEIVEFNNGCFILRHRTLPICEFLTLDHDFEIEVIGNIYQNPELLETVQK